MHVSQTTVVPEQNRYVFNIPLNPDSDNESSLRFLGREFQAEGAEKQKLQFPNCVDHVRRMRSIPEVEERREAHEGSADIRVILGEVFGSQGVKTSVGEAA